MTMPLFKINSAADNSLVPGRVLAADRDPGCFDQLLRQFGADLVTAVVTKPRQTTAREAMKGLCRRILA